MAGMNVKANGNGTAVKALISLASVLVTMILMYFAFFRELPGRSEVKDMIQTYSPYVQDRGSLQDAIKRIDRMNETIVGMQKEQASMNSKLDMLLERSK